MKKIFVDIETTGLDPKKNGIIEISGMVEGVGEERSFSLQCKPLGGDLIDKSSLEVQGISIDDVLKRPDPRDVKKCLISILDDCVDKYDKRDKLHFIGYNAYFDSNFIREWFIKLGDNYYGSYFFHPPIDIMGLAAFKLMERRASILNFKLPTICGEFGIKVEHERLHSSAYDIKITRELFNKLTEKGKE